MPLSRLPIRPEWGSTERAAFWFVLLSLFVFGGEGLGYAVCRLLGVALPQPAALVALAGAAAVAGGVGATLLDRLLIAPYRRLRLEMGELRRTAVSESDIEQQAANRLEQQRRLRHDLRGALSPALLTADRLLVHADPKVKRAGEIMVKSVERASALLAEADAAPSPPAGP